MYEYIQVQRLNALNCKPNPEAGFFSINKLKYGCKILQMTPPLAAETVPALCTF